jgi:hypothetical protein
MLDHGRLADRIFEQNFVFFMRASYPGEVAHSARADRMNRSNAASLVQSVITLRANHNFFDLGAARITKRRHRVDTAASL